MSRVLSALLLVPLALVAPAAWAAPAAAPDRTPPKVTVGKGVTSPLGGTLDDSSAAPRLDATVTWTAQDPSGVCHQRLYVDALRHGDESGAYEVAAGVRSFTVPARVGVEYLISVYATDCAGNENKNTPTNTAYAAFGLQQEKGSHASYSAGWQRSSTYPALSGGREQWSIRAAARTTVSFYGRYFALVSTQAPDRGQARIYVDGTLRQTVDLQGSQRNRVVVAQYVFGTVNADHEVVVEVVGTPGRPRVDVDAFLFI